MRECAEAVEATIAADAGLSEDEARLLAVGLTGLGEVSARFWLTSGRTVPKERAIELLTGLAWRGIGGFPRTG